MGSIEDFMEISFDAQSPYIIATLNSLQTQHESPSPLITPSLDSNSLRTHDESLPLTSVPNDADISLPTHHGTSPPSPEWSTVGPQHGPQIRSQFHQLSHHQTSATSGNLVEEASDLGGILLSLASIIQIHFPDTSISDLIKESKKMPPLLFILDKLYLLRKKLNMQDRYLQSETKNLKDYITELQDECRKHGTLVILQSVAKIPESSFLVILAKLKDMRSDIAPIDYHQVTMSVFNIILGYILGGIGYYINPDRGVTRSYLLQIGTAVACGWAEAQKPH
ncbi:uncharacterized protein FMAN_14297 [Fusarium mangiferae]|uniref:Uncharacterized protein n=1 Tax=Fusarium mangiferae TaxID=192010 RepID=A0A1L7UEE9_FUSMA|nr:uncharacterized protein FMAN_14297 [Fusarium mangiferae]CVL09034.1 uncharacterized protein FMAN_14297 [Fusarium mangiferae]